MEDTTSESDNSSTEVDPENHAAPLPPPSIPSTPPHPSAVVRDGVRDKKLFLMTAYFTKDWDIYCYFFFFDDENEKVLLNERVYRAKDPHDLTKLFSSSTLLKTCEGSRQAWLQETNYSATAERIDGDVQKSLHTKDVTKMASDQNEFAVIRASTLEVIKKQRSSLRQPI